MLQCICTYESYNFAPAFQSFKPQRAFLSGSCFSHYSVSIILLERDRHPVLSWTALFCFEVFQFLLTFGKKKKPSDLKNLIHVLTPLIAPVFLCAYKHLQLKKLEMELNFSSETGKN